MEKVFFSMEKKRPGKNSFCRHQLAKSQSKLFLQLHSLDTVAFALPLF